MALNPHQRTRNDHSREMAEDYVEMIASLIASKGEARAVDLAERFGVSQANVAKMVQRLRREGLVTAEPYRSIFLTETGTHLASQSEERHALVLAFLKAIGVSADVAESDAEGIEHHVSQQTLEAMRQFVEGSL